MRADAANPQEGEPTDSHKTNFFLLNANTLRKTSINDLLTRISEVAPLK